MTELTAFLAASGPLTAPLLGLLAGLLLGLAHFRSLWWNVRIYTGGGGLRALALQLLRLGLLGGVLLPVAKLGALPLLCALAGLLLARALLLRRLGRVP